jgi:hypothetical protein
VLPGSYANPLRFGAAGAQTDRRAFRGGRCVEYSVFELPQLLFCLFSISFSFFSIG